MTAPVIDGEGHLLGWISIDDVVDVIREEAEHTMLAGAGLDEEDDMFAPIVQSARRRWIWLSVNLVTAFLAAFVLYAFEPTLDQIVATAVLFPIVMSMGGIAGTQTLTVMVRKMALGDIDVVNAKDAVIKEATVALLNGFIFAVLMGIVAYIWFDVPRLGLVIGLAMVFNLLIAGLFGAFIPLMLKRMNIDPAVGSSVLLTTATDVFGFLSFLGLASLILIK